MKKILFLLFFITFCAFSQQKKVSYKQGEFLKYRINYGLINAGFATLEINETMIMGTPNYHVVGNGYTTGMINIVFPVKDVYQTYFNPKTMQPNRFIRKIDEGGYKKDKEILFDYKNQQAKVINYKNNWEKFFTIEKGVQDMLSSLYYLRGLNFDNFKEGEIITLLVFYDEEINKIKLVFKGREIVQTKWGQVKTLVFNPMVQTGRVFKNEESVTLWLTDDDNKIPLKIKAAILVGSLKAELYEYSGLTNPFPIIF
jgi:hypothetical protein